MMTILQSITSGRANATNGAAALCWPDDTQHTSDDILVCGASLASAAREGQTPLVRISEARPSPDSRHQRFVTVVVTRVEHVDHLGMLQRPYVWIDATLGSCTPVLTAARIIGRPIEERRQKVRMLSESDPSSHFVVTLPADVCAGDFLAIPCVGTVPRSYVAAHRAAANDSPATAMGPDEDQSYYGICGK